MYMRDSEVKQGVKDNEAVLQEQYYGTQEPKRAWSTIVASLCYRLFSAWGKHQHKMNLSSIISASLVIEKFFIGLITCMKSCCLCSDCTRNSASTAEPRAKHFLVIQCMAGRYVTTWSTYPCFPFPASWWMREARSKLTNNVNLKAGRKPGGIDAMRGALESSPADDDDHTS